MKKRKQSGKSGNLPELKGKDTHLNQLASTTWVDDTNGHGSAEACNMIAQGTGAFERLGNRICLKSLRIGMAIQYACKTFQGNMPINASADPPSSFVEGTLARIVVVWDQRPTATIPDYKDVFYETSYNGTKLSSPMSLLGLDAASRFRILRDMKVKLDPLSQATGSSAATTGGGCIHYEWIDMFINLEGYETTYNQQGASLGSIETGAIYVYARVELSDDHLEARASFAVSRLRYTDP